MTRTLITALLTTVALSGAASADDQLARSAGVEPGVYTTSELARLRSAVEANDPQRFQAAVNDAEARQNDVVLSTQSPVASNTQLARSVGVEPGVYTVAELARLRSARETSDSQEVQAVLEQAAARQGGAILSTQSPTAVDSQLARSLGVEPGAYTASELAHMFIDAHD